jgi:hypothetical protein
VKVLHHYFVGDFQVFGIGALLLLIGAAGDDDSGYTSGG